MLKDSYEIFINRFIENQDDFIEWAISETVFFDENDAHFENQWNEIKMALAGNNKNHKVYIRKNGNNGVNNGILKKFYNCVFPDTLITIDQSNNASTHSKVDKIGIYRRYKRGQNEKDDHHILMKNYRVSHIFENTANPYLFHAPWNFCLTPAIVDPLTGHESDGTLTHKYKKLFYEAVFRKYEKYITEYNDILNNGLIQRIHRIFESDSSYLKLTDVIEQQWKPIERKNYLT